MRVLAGGTAAWKAAGLPLETGMGPLADEPDDVSLSARDRPAERERYMREYLAWEIDLVNQIARDTDCRFRLAPAAASHGCRGSLHGEESADLTLVVAWHYALHGPPRRPRLHGRRRSAAAPLARAIRRGRKEPGNAGFEAFEEIGRPSRLALLARMAWRGRRHGACGGRSGARVWRPAGADPGRPIRGAIL